MNNYYVYFWKRKLDDYIFHIGFGHNNRMYCIKRNKYFNRFYNKYECYVEIYKDNLSKEEAAKLEKELIDYYHSIGQACTNLHEGGFGGNTFKYLPEEDLKKIKNKIGKHSKENWKDPIIKEKMLTNQKQAMSSSKVKQLISINTKKAMQSKEVHDKVLKRATKIIIILPNKEIIEFESTTQFHNYCKKNYGSTIRYNVIHYNGNYYLKHNSLQTLKPFIGWTIISIDKNGNKDVTTICDECSRVDKK